MNYFNKLFEFQQYPHCPVFCLIIFSHNWLLFLSKDTFKKRQHVPFFQVAGTQFFGFPTEMNYYV